MEVTPCEEGNRKGSDHGGVESCPVVDQNNHVGDQTAHDREENVHTSHHVFWHRDLAEENDQNGRPVLGHGMVAHPQGVESHANPFSPAPIACVDPSQSGRGETYKVVRGNDGIDGDLGPQTPLWNALGATPCGAQ